MSPYPLLEKHTKTYKPKQSKIYFNLTEGDIIQVMVGISHPRYKIESGEMFEFIENVRDALYRVRRISNGKVYKIYTIKFIAGNSYSYVRTWEEVSRNCIWNKKK